LEGVLNRKRKKEEDRKQGVGGQERDR